MNCGWNRLRNTVGTLLGLSVGALFLPGQTAITSATISSSDGADEVVNGRTYRNTILSLDSFDAGGETYAITGSADTVYVRRGSSGSNRSHIWYDTASAQGDRYAGYVNDIGDAILANNLHVGTHNLFANAGSSSANIERVDLMTTGGFTAGEGFAIPVFDFGVNPQHESFKIALVTAVDGSGNPSAYSDLASTTPFTATNIHTHDTFSIERFSAGDDTSGVPYTIFNTTNDQGPGGVIFTLDDFNVTSGSTIYGYSLFGFDVSTGGDSANLVDWNNSTYFPGATPGGEGTAGGFDFAAVNGVFFQDINFAVVPEPSASIFGGIALIMLALCRRPRRAS
ncbi:MAG: hypothetical protein SynsKO_22710 [Synoicihabitans sp.]